MKRRGGPRASASFTFPGKSPLHRVRKRGSRRSGTGFSLRARSEFLPPSTTSGSRGGTPSPSRASPGRRALLGEPRYLEAARSGARFLLDAMRDGAGRLLRTWKDGEAKIPAFLEDEALSRPRAPRPRGGGGRRPAAGVLARTRRPRRRLCAPLPAGGRAGLHLLRRGARDASRRTGAISSTRRSRRPRASAALRARAPRAEDRRRRSRARGAEAVDEVSWLMTRSPHGTESWYFALDELLEFDRENPEAGVGALLALRGEGGAGGRGPKRTDSSKVKGRGGGKRRSASSGSRWRASVSFPSKHRAKRGTASRIPLTLRVTDGWHLQGADGIRDRSVGRVGFHLRRNAPPPELHRRRRRAPPSRPSRALSKQIFPFPSPGRQRAARGRSPSS